MVKTMYTGVEGVSRNVKAGYIGVDGVARQFTQSIDVKKGNMALSRGTLNIPDSIGKQNLIVYTHSGSDSDRRPRAYFFLDGATETPYSEDPTAEITTTEPWKNTRDISSGDVTLYATIYCTRMYYVTW